MRNACSRLPWVPAILLAPMLVGADLAREGDTLLFGTSSFAIRIDAGSGAFAGIMHQGRPIAESTGDERPFDVKQDNGWALSLVEVNPELIGTHVVGEHTLGVTSRVGDWEMLVAYRLQPSRFRLCRSLTVTWRGEAPTKLRGVWLATPSLLMNPEAGLWFSPGHYPPRQYRIGQGNAGRRQAFSQSPQPLVVQTGPEWSIIFANNELTPNSDHGSVSATEEESGRLRIAQGFTPLGHVKPGESQHIGEAWLAIVPGDAETGLLRLQELIVDLGHRVPLDRPDWFPEAILYSFHPGGTIGSGFRDLGGFVPATAFLDHVADLGCNAVWVMPIEDVSPYHPRDYYTFQQGLGSPADYRQLIARGHELGLSMIQDLVPHGGSNDFPRAKDHPEWLAQEEDGSTLSYWCFDFNWPEWRGYMAGVADHYVREYGIDGYRVDACGGSKIPNWNPTIPYERASFAKLQGGLNMLTGLRSAVKTLKPKRGGLLAETSGSVYGTVSDAIYDFALCYQVMQDARKMPPQEFVRQVRRWLHEQQHGETPDLLRLRHIESHDSLRSQLWYGIRPQRALMALSTWIHGIPLVYHEMEDGSRAIFQRILAIRRHLPELNGPHADYLGAQAEPGVFACLRRDGRNASVILVNLNPTAASGEVSVPLDRLPESLRSNCTARDLWLDRSIAVLLQGDTLMTGVPLPPFAFTVLALRAADTDLPPLARSPSRWADDAPDIVITRRTPVDWLEIKGGGVSCFVDTETGLPAEIVIRGMPVTGAAELFLPVAAEASGSRCTVRDLPCGFQAELSVGPRRLCMTYSGTPYGIDLLAEWDGGTSPLLAIPVHGAKRWFAACAEGVFEDVYYVRHTTGNGWVGSIYWRPQGTHVLWDSRLHPLGLQTGTAQFGARAADRNIIFRTAPDARPAQVRWLDRIDDDRHLTLLLGGPAIADVHGTTSFRVRIGSGTIVPDPVLTPSLQRETDEATPAGPGPDLVPIAGGWEFENAHYRLRLSRSGMITNLWQLGAEPKRIIKGADLYTDAGYSTTRKRFGASNDVEAAAAFHRDGPNTVLRFEGQLRGSYRFDLLKPPIRYVVEYTLSNAPTFRLTTAAHADSGPSGKFAFLSQLVPLEGVGSVVFLNSAGATLAEGNPLAVSERICQTTLSLPSLLPDRVTVKTEAGADLVSFSGICCGGAEAFHNVFMHRHQLFFAWEDGPPGEEATAAWRWSTMLVTPGGITPVPLGQPTWTVPQDDEASILRDGGFESAASTRMVGLTSGRELPPDLRASAWHPPSGGGLVTTPVHSGSASAQVVSKGLGYPLWRQVLPVSRFPVGSRWRLTAWVKGQNITRGDVNWKVGTIRFAVGTDRTRYISCQELVGTFDWREERVEWTVPPGLTFLEVQVGLNGSPGTIWIDDATLTRLEDQAAK